MGQVLVLGLISGGIYALFALGVVLVYRGTGVLTFAQGEIGTFGLYLSFFLVHDAGVPWVVGSAVAVVAAAAIGGLSELLFIRRMRSADPVSTSVFTVGLGLFLLTLELAIFKATPRTLEAPFKGGLHLFGVFVNPTQIIALVLAVALGVGLQALLRRTDFGLAMLAAAQDPAAVRLVGAPLSLITLVTWSAGAALAGLAAVLIEPTVIVFTPGYATELFIFGLGGAVVGGLNSLRGAVVGSLAIGLIGSAATRLFGSYGLPGLDYVVLLVVVLLSLLGRAYGPDLRRRLAEPSRPAVASGVSA